MGVVYDFLEFLNQGTIPNHPERSQSNNALLQYLIDKARDSLSSTYGGDLVLWMLDHGVQLRTPKTSSRTNDSYYEHHEQCESGVYTSVDYSEFTYTSFRSNGQHNDSSVVNERVTSYFTSQERSASLRSVYHVTKTQVILGDEQVYSTTSQISRNYKWNSPDYLTRFISGSKIDWTVPVIDSFGNLRHDFFGTTLRLVDSSEPATCIPYFWTDRCGHLSPTAIRHPDTLDPNACNLVDLTDIDSFESLPRPSYGYITFVQIGDDYFFPAFSTTTLSQADTIKFLMELPIQRVAVRYLPEQLRSPVINYLFGDLDVPEWFTDFS